MNVEWVDETDIHTRCHCGYTASDGWMYYVQARSVGGFEAAYWDANTYEWKRTHFPPETTLDEAKAAIVAMHKLEGN